VCTPRANHKLPYAPRRVRRSARSLQTETLVVVIVAGEDHLCAIRIKGIPRRSHLGVVAVFSRAEEGMVEVGQRIGLQTTLQRSDPGHVVLL